MDAEWPVRHETGNCGCGIDHCMTLCNVRTVVAVGLVLCHDHAVLSISRLDVNVLAVGRQREKLSRFSWLFCITFFHLHHWGLLVCFSSNACPKWSMQVLIEISLPFDLPTWLSTQPCISLSPPPSLSLSLSLSLIFSLFPFLSPSLLPSLSLLPPSLSLSPSLPLNCSGCPLFRKWFALSKMHDDLSILTHYIWGQSLSVSSAEIDVCWK